MTTAEDQKKPVGTKIFSYLAKKPPFSVTTAISIFLATAIVLLWLYTMYSTLFGQAETFNHASTFYLISLVLVFVLHPVGRQTWRSKLNLYSIFDIFLVLATLVVFLYIKWDIDALIMRGNGSFATFDDRVIGVILILLTLEATRRTVGASLAILAGLFFVYGATSDLFPAPLGAAAVPWGRMIDMTFFDSSGIFGLPVAVASTYIVIFLIFGALLFNTGIGKLFTDLAFILTGKARGGPAKASVVGSTMFGMITGSASANVAVVGTITIPLMKRAGYRGVVAAGIEGAASVGSLVAPPIMGAGAFVMAAFMGTNYWDVVVMAIIPAALYYWYVFMNVHFEAVRMDIKPWSGAVPAAKTALIARGHLLIPIIILVVLLVIGMSAAQAAMWGALAAIGVSYFKKSTALTPWLILDAMETAIRNGLIIFVACGAAGIIIGSVVVTGLGTRFTELLVIVSGGHLWAATIFTAVIGLFLGLGLTPTVVYLTMYALVIPALVLLGASEPGAHFMAFYYGLLGELTPPVAIAAFTAAAIAGVNPISASWQTMRIGLAIYLLPMVFVYSPELLLIGSTKDIVLVSVGAFIGMFLMAAASSGAMITRIGILQRCLLAISAVCFLFPVGWQWTLVGLILGSFVIIQQKFITRTKTSNKPIREHNS